MTPIHCTRWRQMWLAAFGLLACLCWCGAAAQAVVAGRFERIDGAVTVLDATGVQRPAVTGAAVGVGERVETQVGATAHVVLADGGLLVVRPDTTVAVLQYRAQAKLATLIRIHII